MNMLHKNGIVSTGVQGLDAILGGGYPRDRIMLIEGEPGSGKTTLALQFLIRGSRAGERALFFSIAQSEQELRFIADSHNMDLGGIAIVTPALDNSGLGNGVSIDTTQSQLFALMQQVHTALETHRPDLLVFDSLLELRLLAASEMAYRRETLNLRQSLRDRGITSLLLDHLQPQGGERHAEGIAHGVIRLDTHVPPIGVIHRRLNVIKLRGMVFREGFHDFRIRTGGLEVFGRVVPTQSSTRAMTEALPTANQTLNDMLGGGLDFGTTTLIAGQSGTGKSSLSTMFADAAARKGYKAALFLFEERPEVFRQRSRSIGLATEPHEENGFLSMSHFDPAEISPGEFSCAAVNAVEEHGVRLVVIDSLSGYLNALPDRHNVTIHLHTLMQYLSRRGVLVIVTMAQHGLLGEPPRTEIDSSYLADSVILLRHYAAGSAVRRSIAVLKKRHTPHGRQIQELVIAPAKVDVQPITEELAQSTFGFPQVGGA